MMFALPHDHAGSDYDRSSPAHGFLRDSFRGRAQGGAFGGRIEAALRMAFLEIPSAAVRRAVLLVGDSINANRLNCANVGYHQFSEKDI